MSEIYKSVSEYPNYEVSSLGNVKNIITGRILKQNFNGGQFHVNLFVSKDIKVNKTVHRLVADAFLFNPEDKEFVDHIDRDNKNNNMLNLRYATESEIHQKRSIQTNNKSGVIGVFQRKNNPKWFASIRFDHDLYNLGSFDSFETAVKARKRAERKYFGDFRPI